MDCVFFNERGYDLVGIEDEGLVDPENFGIEPEPVTGACGGFELGLPRKREETEIGESEHCLWRSMRDRPVVESIWT